MSGTVPPPSPPSAVSEMRVPSSARATEQPSFDSDPPPSKYPPPVRSQKRTSLPLHLHYSHKAGPSHRHHVQPLPLGVQLLQGVEGQTDGVPALGQDVPPRLADHRQLGPLLGVQLLEDACGQVGGQGVVQGDLSVVEGFERAEIRSCRFGGAFVCAGVEGR